MTKTARTHRKTWTRRVLGTTLTLILTAATLAGIVLAGVVVSSRSIHPPVPTDSADTAASSLTHTEPGGSKNSTVVRDGQRLVVAVVAGTEGTIASDLLAPYDIFSSSPAFTTYVVADAASPAALEGGPAVVPTHTFADVDADSTLRPDVVVVPGLTKPTGTAEVPLRSWVARQHASGARILGVCSGSIVLAATGMLDGLDATSHWSRISALEKSRPTVNWMRGRRYVEDGSVTTTAAVTSGVPAALHLVAELAGPAEAQRVANLHPELKWTPTETTTIPADHFAAHDWPVGFNVVMPWFRPTVGIALGDGVGELDATAAFEVYGQSSAARTVPLAAADTVRTGHGLALLTTSYSHAPELSRVVVPGVDTPDAIDPRLRALAQHQVTDPWQPPLRGRVQRSAAEPRRPQRRRHPTTTAKMIGYPATDLDLGDATSHGGRSFSPSPASRWRSSSDLTPAFLVRRRRRRANQAGSLPIASSANDTEAATHGVNVNA